MEALDRIPIANNWITFVFLLGIILLLMMKSLKPKRLLGYLGAFFILGFIEERTEKKVAFLAPFHLLLFFFSILTISLTCYFTIASLYLQQTFPHFLTIMLLVFVYIIVRFSINFIIIKIVDLKQQAFYFFISSVGYLYTVCLLLFPMLIIYQYGFKNPYFLYVCIGVVLLMRAILILLNNKKLIFSQLFYFILYFCTLELAPWLIFYKTTTT